MGSHRSGAFPVDHARAQGHHRAEGDLRWTTEGILIDAYDRIAETAHSTLDGHGDDALTYKIDPEANTIGWLVWHAARVQDDHIAGVAGSEPVYTAGGWNEKFALPFDDGDIGYGQSPDQAAEVVAGAELVGGYVDAVHARTRDYLQTVTPDDLDSIVDENWDPLVTLAVRLISVVSDDLQHLGPAAYVRGVFERR